MKRKSCLFVDQVSRTEVFLYVDCYGVEWMASYNWSDRMERESKVPKKIKRKDIYYIANLNAFDKDGSSAITDAMCELLGDLVEQDKGGAE
jgi:hypothetical protein